MSRELQIKSLGVIGSEELISIREVIVDESNPFIHYEWAHWTVNIALPRVVDEYEDLHEIFASDLDELL